jgi:hypothetical protein
MTDVSIRHFYDIFISHNRVDKAWASALATRLSAHLYNGRPLRPWLDEQFLDPGEPASNSELTTAIDRSRTLGLVLSPEALASKWVDFELEYFLGRREKEAVVVMLRRSSELREAVRDLPWLDFRSDGEYDSRFEELLTRLCPASDAGLQEVSRRVDLAFKTHVDSDPGSFAAGPTRERDDLFKALTRFNIDDAASEGLAIAAFERAAELLLRLHERGAEATYNTKMLLGECLAAALTRSAGYRQVAQRFLDIAEGRNDDSVLLFVLARSYSKLSEIDPLLVDTSVLIRMASQLDAKRALGSEEKAIETLLGRVLGKLRGTPGGDLLIKTLSKGGRSSRIAAIGGISLSYHRGAPVFYLSELERIHARHAAEQELVRDPPSKRMLALLFGMDLGQHEDVGAAQRLAKQDIEHDFPGTDFPYAHSWLGLREGIPITNLSRAPFMGTVVKATLGNMVELSTKVGVSKIACLTEPRIVDALFRDCGALLILEQDADSHQCRRLRGRGVPYGMLSPEAMAILSDGDVIAVDRGCLTLWSRSHAPDWPQPKTRKPEPRRKPKKSEPKLRAIRGVKELMRETITPHLEAMTTHIDTPLRLEIVIESKGCKPSPWSADFKPGSVTVVEGEASSIKASLHVDIDDWPEFIKRDLSWDNVMKELYGDSSRFSTLFEAWNAALDEQ